jgi:hypothetical protein
MGLAFFQQSPGAFSFQTRAIAARNVCMPYGRYQPKRLVAVVARTGGPHRSGGLRLLGDALWAGRGVLARMAILHQRL